MIRTFIVSILFAALFGCASSGRIGELPAIAGDQSSSELVLVRPSNFIGAANSYYVSLDGKDVFSIRSGDYTKFRIPSGPHTVFVKCFGGWTPTWKEDGKQFIAEQDQSNYFEISPSLTCAKVVQIGPVDAMKLLAANRFVSPGVTSNRDADTLATGRGSTSQSETRRPVAHASSSDEHPSAPSANMPAPPGTVPTYAGFTPEYRRTGTANVRILISSHADWDRSCRAVALPSVTIVQPPKHGHIEVVETDFVIKAARVGTNCLGQMTHGRSVTYIADNGFQGMDQIAYRVTSPFADTVHTAEVSVR